MVRYTPKMGSPLWERKSQVSFETVEEMKNFIAERATAFRRFAGADVCYDSSDVVLNGSRIMMDGMMVGYCGE